MAGISLSQMFNSLSQGIARQQVAESTQIDRVSSGRNFNTPSEDASGYRISLNIRHLQEVTNSSLKALSTAKTRLDSTTTTLGGMMQVVQRAMTVATQLSNGGNSLKDMQASAKEVAALRDHLLNMANSKWNGDYMFSGTAINTQPFVMDPLGNVTYKGNNTDRTVIVSELQNITTGVKGNEAAFTNMFAGITQLYDGLVAGNSTAVAASIPTLDKSTNGFLELSTRVGGWNKTVQLQQSTYGDYSSALDTRLKENEGADMADAAMKLSTAQTALKSSYSVVSQLRSMNLVNFLR